jgi:hypothetical protein
MSRARLCEEQTGHPRIVMPMTPRYHNKTAEEYRQLAEKCRETARMISWDNERGRLLKMAQVWDLIADRVERAAHKAFEVASTRGHAAAPRPVK